MSCCNFRLYQSALYQQFAKQCGNLHWTYAYQLPIVSEHVDLLQKVTVYTAAAAAASWTEPCIWIMLTGRNLHGVYHDDLEAAHIRKQRMYTVRTAQICNECRTAVGYVGNLHLYIYRRRRKFTTSIQPAKAYEDESVIMSGPH